jgi:hypothetical protein
MQLPALTIQIKGEVTLSNLPDFKAKAEAYIASIKTDLQTDNDFANAEETIKFCDAAEKSLELSKAAAISQTHSIDELMRTVDNIKDQLRNVRLSLTKTVKDKKESIKMQILNDSKQAFVNHLATLDAEISPFKIIINMPDFGGAMKNKRTLSSLHDAVDTLISSAKIEANDKAQQIRAKQSWFNSTMEIEPLTFLFTDIHHIIHKPFDDFKILVTSRIDSYEADLKRKAAEVVVPDVAVRLEIDRVVSAILPAVVAKIVAPTRDQIISAIAMKFGTDFNTAKNWIEAAFFKVTF